MNQITVEECRSANCSMGFIITGSGNVVRRCTVEDAGGGVYVGGENATVENCRLFKRRDAFMVPSYAQDDTGIQYYHPARSGSIRGNLCEGFGMGVFIKAIVNYTEYRGEMKRIVSMAQWREFSDLDRHTLFADPLYRDSAARDFRLEAKSPNRGAGADGATIGAPGDWSLSHGSNPRQPQGREDEKPSPH